MDNFRACSEGRLGADRQMEKQLDDDIKHLRAMDMQR
jgi:hypothetical protein